MTYDSDFIAWWTDSGSKLAAKVVADPEAAKPLCYVAWLTGEIRGADKMTEVGKDVILRGYADSLQRAKGVR